MKKQFIKRLLLLILGLIILAWGIALFIQAKLGADPYTSLNIGISQLTHINFAVVQIGLNLLILIGIVLIDKSTINIGTVLALFGVGPLIQLFTSILQTFLPPGRGFIGDIMVMLVGCLLVSIGAGIYISSELGFGPYDILPIVLECKCKWSFKWARILLDSSCVILAVLMGATIGIGTLVATLCLGPAIEWIRNLSKKYLLS